MVDHEILVLRHGQTEWNLERVACRAALDSPLTGKGARAGAKPKGRILAGLDLTGLSLWFTSPQGRSVETVAHRGRRARLWPMTRA